MPQTIAPTCDVCGRRLPAGNHIDICRRCLKIEEGEDL